MSTRAGIRAQVEAAGHRAMRRIDHAAVPGSLRARWRTPPDADPVWLDRLRRDRTEILPWLDDLVPLAGSEVLEIGSGRGASTFALTEQGAQVTAVDVNAGAVAYATARLSDAGLEASFNLLNVERLAEVDGGPFDLVLFWASLEHMTTDERTAGLREGWSQVAAGGAMAIIETPNRLWPFDSHTSDLAFFNWLPDDVAFAYLPNTPRSGLDRLSDPEEHLLDFQRLGRGVSFHDVDLALGGPVEPVSCMQLERRRRNPARRLAWAGSSSGAVERMLRRFAPDRDRAWFQPFLYLAFRKPTSDA